MFSDPLQIVSLGVEDLKKSLGKGLTCITHKGKWSMLYVVYGLQSNDT